ncbi:unnamed protein product [Pseudo-nitzschia multistriata]|uniref:tRNA (guanine(46)-N(7))-methyltransferase n=1 Tax=Pseudo-nitzschia multistriata TaxID=183589 RepID=A0A448ZNI1_9STRA|nr:unnamed protein product [Pseudo-nitzschia multistriata]
MNRILATLYFVRSAWSVEALAATPVLFRGPPALAFSSATASLQRTTGIPSNRKWRLRLRSASRWTNAMAPLTATPSAGIDAANANADSNANGTCCTDEEGVRALLGAQDFDRIDGLVRERSLARWQGNYTGADDLKERILGDPGIPGGHEVFLRDLPRREGGGARWSLVPTVGQQARDEEFRSGTKILQLAHAALGLAVEDNQRPRTPWRNRPRTESLEALVDKARARLEVLLEETRTLEQAEAAPDVEVSKKQTTLRTELGGRTAADAALWFALAGTKDARLFRGLADAASWELDRFGQRPSCKSKNVYQILERFSAAGLLGHDRLEAVARRCLRSKQAGGGGFAGETEGALVPAASPNLHSDRSLLLIWKFATKQKKQQAFLRSVRKEWEDYHREEGSHNATETETEESSRASGAASNRPDEGPSSYEWETMFRDATRPLVVDVGCGMGVSLLGLASTPGRQNGEERESARLLLGGDARWSDCNFVGVDLGALGIGYGRGIAHRWDLEGELAFAIDSAEDFCRKLGSYPGEVRCCMIQFPTPFRLQNKDGGNSQLPASQLDGFMVTEKLLETIHSSLHPTRGRLLLQSNCEDVAVWMRNLACRTVGFESIDDDNKDDDRSDGLSKQQRTPQRTLDWMAMGGERAEGRGWFQRNILHRKGATETEATCAINGTPIHRCLLKRKE